MKFTMLNNRFHIIIFYYCFLKCYQRNKNELIRLDYKINFNNLVYFENSNEKGTKVECIQVLHLYEVSMM